MPKTNAEANKPGFTTSLKSLETILDRLKSQSLPLEESLTLFEEGVGHIKSCQATLTQAKGRVDELVKTLQADGQSKTKPFADEED